jgi:hypothetical protein
VFNRIPLIISFHRGLVGNNLNLWYNLVSRVAHIRINDKEDMFRWGLHQNGTFSNSMYGALICDERVRCNMTLWKLQLPLKIKIFMWYIKCGVVLTKDNLVKHDWKGNKKCVFCSQPESI